MMTVKLAGMEALNTKSPSYDQFPEGPGTRALAVIVDRQMICIQQGLIDRMLARGEPAGLVKERLLKLTEDLRNHCFHQDLIQASIRLER
ncbi:hypothetical protein ACVI1T_006671 [Rhizobium redzepovicii]